MKAAVSVDDVTAKAKPLTRLLRRASEELGTQKELAERIGISESRLSQILAGDRKNLNPELLRAVATATRMPLADVVRAALDEYDLPLGNEPMTLERAIAADIDLPESHKQLLLVMVTESRRQTAGADQAGSDT